MLNLENREMCVRLLDKYGHSNQLVLMIEESSELTKEICKMFRNKELKPTEGLVEELTDVIVMAEQCRIMFGISYADINERAKEKLARALQEGENAKA